MSFLLVGLGGAVGSMMRYGVGLAFAGASFPFATLIVNIIGCFAIGLAMPSLDRTSLISPEMRLLVVVGFLGGFTTFSAFGYESAALARTNEVLALINICANLALALGAVFAGRALASALGWISQVSR
ncbi:fluoride efflux transporter CrcB [soil metagenome]